MENRFILFLFAVIAITRAVDNDMVHLENGDSEANIHTFGATIVSWKTNGTERLFLSQASKMDGSSHIMGGVPIIFPKFSSWGQGKPFHGFARITKWNIVNVDGTRAEFVMEDTEKTKEYWNCSFRLNYVVELTANELISTLKIENLSESKFEFQTLYHTFLRVPDVRNISIAGLKGLNYSDKTRNFDRFTETDDALVIDKFTDSIYENTPNTHKITGIGSGGETLELVKVGLPDLVVWNPWSEVIREFDDLEPDEWSDFVCAEAGAVVKPIELEPGIVYEATQILRIVSI